MVDCIGGHTKALRYSSLFVGCLAAGIAYSLDSFTALSEDLRQHFCVSQSSVELTISVGYIGQLTSLPAGFLINRLGHRLLTAVSAILGVSGAFLLFTAVHFQNYYTNNFSLIYLYYFLMGASGGIMYVTACTMNLGNFDDKSMALVSGTINAWRSGLPGLLNLFYMYTYSSDYFSDVYAGRRLHIHFCVVGILFALTNILGLLLYGDHRNTPRVQHQSIGHDYSQSFMTSHSIILESSDSGDRTPLLKDEGSSHESSDKGQQIYIKSIILSWRFHYLFWPTVILLGQRNSFVANIRTFADSFNLQTYSQIMLTILPFLSSLSKPVVGLLSDYLNKKAPRIILVLIWTVALGVAFILGLFFLNIDYIQGSLTTILILTSSNIQTIIPPVMITMFGKMFFPIGWSLVTVGWALLTSGFNIILGYFYDQHVLPGENCYGLSCFDEFFILSIVLTLCCIVLYVLVLREEIKVRKGKRSIEGISKNYDSCMKESTTSVTYQPRELDISDGIRDLK